MAAIGALVGARKFRHFVGQNDDVLDFGCGDGSLLRALGHVRVGVEVNPVAREAAADQGVHVVGATSEVSDESVDVVLSNHALEHTLSPFAELLDLRRVLKGGGRIALAVPADDWRLDRQWRPVDTNHHLYTWTPLSLGNLLDEAGFRVESCTIWRHAWPPRAELFVPLPARAFDLVGAVSSALLRRRQIFATAVKAP
jgi:SAM-dependent methyltransferase